jgi:hypothetical protein
MFVFLSSVLSFGSRCVAACNFVNQWPVGGLHFTVFRSTPSFAIS